ncbi:methyl-accepting chemotaxis protein [Mangrovibacter phragmitis]|uniref:Methyl-accepting chemotaxis protein n=1 Tax=Mangrovibacter phragmitis TaxID=1691903 RepID=A0A1B7KYC6_9ENTR|nr:methyl-accepting chemotaxis protein [Mangrovibacter phragmitis]OAT75036.1 methyl-accepting chemotaxis protein [Mangrovibacter phragmitis]
MTVRRFSLITFTVLLIIYLCSSGTTAWSLTGSNESLDKVNKEIRVVLSIIDPINHSRTMRVKAMEAMNYAAKGDMSGAETALNQATIVLGKADNAFKQYMDAPKYAGEAALTEAYRTAWETYRTQALLPLMDAAKRNDAQTVRELVTTKVPALDRQFEITLDKLLAFHETYARELNQQAQSHFTGSLVTIAVFALVFIALIAASIVLLNRRVLAPLDQAKSLCDSIARGQLGMTITSRARDEIGAMMRSLEEMRLSLVSIISRVRESSQMVGYAAEEIAAGNEDLSARTEEQAASLGETAASMEQLTSTIKQTSDNTAQTSHLASEMQASAMEGNTVMGEVVSSMNVIEASSGKIVSIISIIESIAFQTNILALNAAVEAARAGEQGRGFAVVATEVRNLAQRSSTAAKEIKELIEQSAEQITHGSLLVKKTGESMQRVIRSVSQVTTLMSEIALSSGEQSRGIEQINQAVAQMDTVTQQNAALVEQASAAAQSLKDQAHVLNEAVSVFLLGDQRQETPLLLAGQ